MDDPAPIAVFMSITQRGLHMKHVAMSPAALSVGQKGLDWNPHPSHDLTYLERIFLC
jgi:hypothetical protein